MLRFGVSVWSAASGPAWRDEARRLERLGYDTLWVPDHVGMFDPFTGCVAAAAAAEHMQVGTYVLNIEFWNPLLLARTVATTHLVTGGRLVLGLGAGHAEVEFEQAGLRYPPARRRVERLAATVPAVRRLLAGETVDDGTLGLVGAATGLPPVDPPILVGGNGNRVLALAGEQADIVSLVGFTSGTGQRHTNLSHWSWDGLTERLNRVLSIARAAGREPRVDVLIQRAALTDDPAAALADFTEAGLPAEKLDSPFLLVGDQQHILDHLARLEALGIHGVTVFARDAEALTPALTQRSAN